MTPRAHHCWLLLLLATGWRVEAAPSTSPVIVEPAQRAAFADLFSSAGHGSFARYLIPGRGNIRGAWYPEQTLIPMPDNSTLAAPILGFPIGSDGGSIDTPSVQVGVAQGTGIVAANFEPSASACYMADSGTNDIAAYAVDAVTGQFSNIPGAPFATDSTPNGTVVEPSGRFLYAVNDGASTVTAYAINVTTHALAKIGTTPLSVPPKTALPVRKAINASRQCVFVANDNTGGYESFAINLATGTLTSAPGSPVGSHQALSVTRTPEGNFVYFSEVTLLSGLPGKIDGYFVDPSTCALTAVPGSPFTAPERGILRINPDLHVLYAAGGGQLRAFSIDPGTGALAPLGSPAAIDPDTGAMVVGPKGEFLWLSDLANQDLRTVPLDPATGGLKTVSTPTVGLANVQSMLLFSQSGGELIGRGIKQNRSRKSLTGAPPFTFALVGGAVPPGLSFDDTAGDVTGTATTLGESTFQVKITDAVGASSTETKTLDVIAADTKPAAPSNLTAVAKSPTEVLLSWTDNAGGTAAFSILLSQDGSPFQTVQTARAQNTSTLVTGLSPATSYSFEVRAFNTGGGATDTTAATVTTPNLSPTSCVSGPNGQCLLGGRFFVEAIYNSKSGAGLANVVPITSDTAYLWFFNSANVEVVVKVLDGCGLGGHFWVFAGGLTNVNVVLRVTDTMTGAVRYYEVPFGPAFTPIQDTSAFGTCSFPPVDAAQPTDAAAAATALRQNALSDIASRLAPPLGAARPSQGTALVPACTPSATALCLNNNRFQVSATFDAGAAGSGQAQTVALSSDTGYLWFFGASNVEAVIKVLNGCSLGGHYWVFAGGLTNVNVVVTVRDTQTGATKTYTNPASTVFQPIQDTAAFSACP